MSDRLDNPILHWPNDLTIAGCNQHCHLAEQAGADVHASSGATVAPAPALSTRTAEPRTAAGRALWQQVEYAAEPLDPFWIARVRAGILAIEAEARRPAMSERSTRMAIRPASELSRDWIIYIGPYSFRVRLRTPHPGISGIGRWR